MVGPQAFAPFRPFANTLNEICCKSLISSMLRTNASRAIRPRRSTPNPGALKRSIEGDLLWKEWPSDEENILTFIHSLFTRWLSLLFFAGFQRGIGPKPVVVTLEPSSNAAKPCGRISGGRRTASPNAVFRAPKNRAPRKKNA
jgi:hypothetical protein